MKRNLLRFVLLSVMTLFTLGASAQDYLCFTANTADSKVTLTKNNTPGNVTLLYSTDGTNWYDYTIGTEVALVNANDKVYFRNKDTATTFSKGTSDYYYFVMDGSIAASGNVMSLIDNSCTATTIPSRYCFTSLFNNCTGLTTAPELPATTLAKNCYQAMFSGCTGLTTAPELPATTLAEGCYQEMFSSCSSLTTAPELPAVQTGIATCYSCMFNGCTKLNSIKVGFSTWGKGGSSMSAKPVTVDWVSNVSSTGEFMCPDGLPKTFGPNNIPYGWPVVKPAYEFTVSGAWASMCVNLPLTVPNGAMVYYASAVEGSTITLTQIPGGTVMAPRTAVIVKGTGIVPFPIAGEAGTSYPTNLFKGSSVAKACNEGENYVLNASKSSDTNVHFSIYTGTTLTDHKAYLPKSAVGGASSIQFRFGDATAISTVEMESSDEVLYNMAGQRVSSDYRGIVIKNGKKTWNN